MNPILVQNHPKRLGKKELIFYCVSVLGKKGIFVPFMSYIDVESPRTFIGSYLYVLYIILCSLQKKFYDILRSMPRLAK